MEREREWRESGESGETDTEKQRERERQTGTGRGRGTEIGSGLTTQPTDRPNILPRTHFGVI